MAGFFDKLNKAGQETVQRVKDTTEISKLNQVLQQKENEREQIFAQLGKVFYSMTMNKHAIDIEKEPVSSLFDDIKNCNKDIEKTYEEIARIKSIKTCPNCGRECSKDSVFCSGCGTKLLSEEITNVCNYCSKCNTELSDEDTFCFNCGNKVK